MATQSEVISRAEKFLTSLSQLDEFDKRSVRPVIEGQLRLTSEEECYVVIYNRVWHNVESILALNNIEHFQAIAALARTIFELAVDIRLVEQIPDASEKLII